MALPGEGSKLYLKVAATFVVIGGLEEFDGFEVSAAAVKTSVLSGTTHTYRKSRMIDPGTMTAKIQVDPNDTQHALIYTKVTETGATTPDEFKIEVVDDNTTPANFTFFGFFTKYKLTGEKIEENLIAELEIQLTSLPVPTAGVA
jgi:hypothetical protein